jgi:hypothetical protein
MGIKIYILSKGPKYFDVVQIILMLVLLAFLFSFLMTKKVFDRKSMTPSLPPLLTGCAVDAVQ